MKRYMLSILLIILSFNCFSQKDTNQVILTNDVAKLVVKDLIKMDGCDEERNALDKKIISMNQLIYQKDSQITVLSLRKENLESEKKLVDSQNKLYKGLTEDLQKEIRAEKTKRGLYKYSTWFFLLTTVYFLKFQ